MSAGGIIEKGARGNTGQGKHYDPLDNTGYTDIILVIPRCWIYLVYLFAIIFA